MSFQGHLYPSVSLQTAYLPCSWSFEISRDAPSERIKGSYSYPVPKHSLNVSVERFLQIP